MDLLQMLVIRDAKSMEYFAEGDATFSLGRWRDWHKACREAGKVLPPADFKGHAKAVENNA